MGAHNAHVHMCTCICVYIVESLHFDRSVPFCPLKRSIKQQMFKLILHLFRFSFNTFDGREQQAMPSLYTHSSSLDGVLGTFFRCVSGSHFRHLPMNKLKLELPVIWQIGSIGSPSVWSPFKLRLSQSIESVRPHEGSKVESLPVVKSRFQKVVFFMQSFRQSLIHFRSIDLIMQNGRFPMVNSIRKLLAYII
jgi:hypothetical protein